MPLRILVLFISVTLLTACVTEQTALLSTPSTDNEARAGNYIELAAGYINLGRLETAQQEIAKALEVDPKNPKAHHVAAVLSMKLGDRQAAEKSFRQAIAYKPNNGPSAHELGVLLCKSGNRAEGVRLLTQAAQNQFFSSRSLSYLRAGECLGKSSPRKARGYFDQALKLNPNLDVALFRTAEVLYLEGYPVQSRGYFERYMDKRKHNSQTLLLGYRIESSAQSQTQADSYATQLLNDFPNSAETRKLRELMN